MVLKFENVQTKAILRIDKNRLEDIPPSRDSNFVDIFWKELLQQLEYIMQDIKQQNKVANSVAAELKPSYKENKWLWITFIE